MSEHPPEVITQWLRRSADGEADAMDQLAPLVYDTLRQIAARRLAREPASATWSPTALVNEAFIQLLGRAPVAWRDRSHFYAYAATAMRNILVDHARRRSAHKRGSGQVPANLDDAQAGADDGAESLLQLDQALRSLMRVNPRAAQVVELRYFGGLSTLETAEALQISERSVVRDWELARAWIAGAMRE